MEGSAAISVLSTERSGAAAPGAGPVLGPGAGPGAGSRAGSRCWSWCWSRAAVLQACPGTRVAPQDGVSVGVTAGQQFGQEPEGLGTTTWNMFCLLLAQSHAGDEV